VPNPKAQHKDEHKAHNKRLLTARQLKHEDHDKPKSTRRKMCDVQNSIL
jgi:hypothetical protein